MIFPRGRAAARRYNRRKMIAILITFPVLWLLVKLLPDGTLFSTHKLAPPRLTPAEAFRQRASGAAVRTEAVLERVMSDSVDAGTGRSLRRWRVRSLSGHPFTVLQDPAVGLLRASPGDTVSVHGTYHWSTSGGVVLAEEEAS